jgi:hypothetical protein
MDIEFKENPDTGVLEAWEDGKVVGEFVTAGTLVKGWKLTDCIVRKEQKIRTERKKTA